MSNNRLITTAKHVITDINPLAAVTEIESKSAQSYNPLANNFEFFSDTDANMIICGSTQANLNDEAKTINEASTDASEFKYVLDQYGVRTGFIMSSASSTAPAYHIAEASAAGYICQEINNKATKPIAASTEEMTTIIGQVGEACKTAKIDTWSDQRMQATSPSNPLTTIDNAHTAVATSLIVSDEKNQPQGTFVNVGDNMIIVFNGKNHLVKKVFAARDYIVANADVTLTAQDLAQPNNRYKIQGGTFLLESGDIVVQCSPGLWQNLNFDTMISSDPNNTYKEYTLSNQPYEFTNSQSLAANLLAQALEKAELTRKQIAAIRSKLIKKIAKFNADTNTSSYNALHSWTSKLLTSAQSKTFTPETREFVQQIERNCFLKSNQKDPITLSDVAPLRTGYSTTIAVAQVPDPKVELVRAFIETKPENAENIIPRLISLGIDKQAKNDILNRLANEKKLARSSTNGISPDKAVFTSVYNTGDIILASTLVDLTLTIAETITDVKEQQDLAKRLARTAANLMLAINGTPSKTDKQKCLITFLNDTNTPLSFKERAILFKLAETNVPELNNHKHNILDKLFGIKNTTSWKRTITELRVAARSKLWDEVNAEQDTDKKLILLNEAKKQNIINEYTSNFTLFGLRNKTASVKQIEQKIKEINKAQSLITNKI
jgi:hypothetical protein